MKSLLFITVLFFALPAYSQVDHLRQINSRPGHTTVYVNEYTNVTAFDRCGNRMTVGDASNFSKGDTILIIQMQGALIDSSNTPGFGNIIDYRHTGNYEFNYVAGILGNQIVLGNLVTRTYEVENGKVQLVNIHPFVDYTVSDPVACKPWDGSTGGVVALFVKDTLTLYQGITATGLGFRGGVTANFMFNTLACGQTDYYADSASWQYARKGEGIELTGYDKWNGRGKGANGGGGGNAHNSGGGGGGNYKQGGHGGYQLDSCSNAPFNNGGVGGEALNYSNAINELFMGGGGGAGHMDSNNPAFNASGGEGGGIVIIKAGYLRSNNYIIDADGGRGKYCYACTNDGTGGGGAGGTILMDVGSYLDTAMISAGGGDGSWMLNWTTPKERVGPGGGGAGGVIWFAGNISVPSKTTVTGGGAGIIYDDAQNPWGALPGNNGATLYSLKMPVDTLPFTLPMVSINDSISNCNRYSFKANITPNFFSVASRLWNFGDGVTDTAQNPFHTYRLSANFQVTIRVTDTNGCVSDTAKTVAVSPIPHVVVTKSNDIDCFHKSAQLHATGAIRYLWKPHGTLSDDTIPDPVASPTVQTTYTVTGWDDKGCTDTTTVTVNTTMSGKPEFLMPSAFTPNKDGLNDCFGINNWEAIEQLNFTIYNRWGQPIFHSEKPGECWDGKFKGEYANTGTYIFVVHAKTLCGNLEKKGAFVLIR